MKYNIFKVKINMKKTISLFALVIVLVANTSIISKAESLNTVEYENYVSKMSKELNDIDYLDASYNNVPNQSHLSYPQLVLDKKKLDFKYKTKFPNFNRSFNFKTDVCYKQGYSLLAYYLIFGPNCTVFINNAFHTRFLKDRDLEIAKNDGFGYDSYLQIENGPGSSLCQFFFDDGLSQIEFDLKYPNLLKKENSFYIDEELRINTITYHKDCKTKFKEKYPKFKADKNKCITNDWIIYEMEVLINPHCSEVNIFDVPQKLSYYMTSWGVVKVGEKPDTSKPKINDISREESLADDNPEKSEAVKKAQKEKETKFQEEKRKLEIQQQGTSPYTIEEDKKFNEEYKKKQVEEKNRLDNLRAPSPEFLTRLKTFYYSNKDWINALILMIIISVPLVLIYFVKIKRKK
jgi:hypothetical protein